MAARNKTFRLDDSLVEALSSKAASLEVSESDIVRKALVCFLGLKFDKDCNSFDELQQVKTRLDNLINRLQISDL